MRAKLNTWIYKNSPFMIFQIPEIRENHIWGEFVIKIREFTLIFIFVNFPQNDNLGLKMKIFRFLGIKPIYKSEFFETKSEQ